MGIKMLMRNSLCVYIFACALSLIACAYVIGLLQLSVCAQSTTSTSAPASDKQLRGPILLKHTVEKDIFERPFSLPEAVEFAQQNYPNVIKSQAMAKAAKENITVQKLNEYLPNSLFQWQELMASHNKLTEVFFGSPVFPAVSGPGNNPVSMYPDWYSGAGFSLDWAPIDFGLHKARINLAKTMYGQATSQLSVTKLDVSTSVASMFLDAVEAIERVRAAEENKRSFQQFKTVVDAQVRADLKPGADASLAIAQLANAENELLRARLGYDLAVADLAAAMGIGGRVVTIDPTGLTAEEEPAQLQKTQPIFENVPILQSAQQELSTVVAQRKVLDKEYYPVFHFLGGVQLRGSGLSNTGQPQTQGASGVFPVIPNYQMGMIINWNFLDWFRIHAEKKVQDQRVIAEQQTYNLVFQNLKAEDQRSRARVNTAVQLAANMPVQVQAAQVAVNQAEARYRTGLGSVAQVAEANQVLAVSRMQQAVARVGVWRALLTVASVHGDMQPFLAEAERIQSSRADGANGGANR